ncbi:hypothetical protein WG954_14305 [Lacibacter sp. H375]|uniref:hypothetical protein n=1 Tax=Lacibacter sp. H375 TaxID=3133424 RepID=UPI0030C4B8A4
MRINFGVTLCCLVLCSCKTYYITTESLKKQFASIDSAKLKSVTVRGPIGEKYNYLANGIPLIYCTDKSGNTVAFSNSPSIEVRVTELNGKKTIFYFDRLFISDSTLYGVRSRFISAIRKEIKLADIKKIEVQDGGKNFSYVN